MSQMRGQHDFSCQVINPTEGQLRGKGRFDVQCHNPDGSLAWEESFSNGNTNSGLNDILSVAFAAGTQKTAWFLGLVDNTSFSAFAVGDTIASHAGWLESTAYTESVRQTWTPTVSSQQVTNATAATFTMNASVTIKGAFLVSNSQKGGSSGQLWATGAFASNQVATSGQVITVRYTYSVS